MLALDAISFDLIEEAKKEKWKSIRTWLQNHVSDEVKEEIINKHKNESEQTVLHITSEKGNKEITERLLDAGAKISKDSYENTPFHTACLWGNLETADVFLKRKLAEIDDRAIKLAVSKGYENMKVIELLLEHTPQQRLRQLALYHSISMEHKEVALKLLSRPDWPSLMRYKIEDSDQHTQDQDTCFREMIRKMPDVAEEILNRCTKRDPMYDVCKDKLQVAFNYEFIEDARTRYIQSGSGKCVSITNPEIQSGSSDNSDIQRTAQQAQNEEWSYRSFTETNTNEWGPPRVDQLQKNKPIAIMVQYKRLNLLAHPLVASLLYSKWQRFGLCLYIWNLLTYCLFLLLLTTFAFIINNPQSESCLSIANSTDIDCVLAGISTHRLNGVLACAVFVLLTASFRLVLEGFQFKSTRSAYIKNWINYLEIVLYLTSIIFVWVFHFDCLCPSIWQWQLGIVAVFLGWANLIVFVSNIPFIGIYVLMFSHIFFTFLKVLIFSLLLIVTFGLTFYFAFTQPDITRSPFSSPQRSLLKVLTMTTGEFEFDSIFRQDPSGESDYIEEIPFLPFSVILWIVFIIIMPILFTNLLIGLAVGDIHEIREQAEIRKLIQQAKLLLSFEEFLRAVLTVLHLQHRFGFKYYEIVKPFEKRYWYDKLKLQLWGGEQYFSLTSLNKVINSQNCKYSKERQLVLMKDAVTQTDQ